MEISISLLSPEERKYTYTQSQQLIQQLGCIGHLRADLGSGGQFFSNWNDHYASLDTKDFKQEFEQVMSALRLGPLYIDKHDRIIQDHDRISYDDGTVATIRIMKDGLKDCRITATEYHSSSQNVKEEYPPLTDVAGTGLRKLSNAELIDLDASESRENSAFCGAILESRDKLREFCLDNPSAVFGSTQEWGIRVNAQEYSYLMRLCPDSTVNNLFCYCYRRDWLDQHIQQARHGIRFISPMYEELFRIADGDQIRIICDNGENKDRTVRYIDDYHIELEAGFSSNIYHICEFAEMIERCGNSIIPLRSSLPEKCFVYVEASD